jgi:hypothetical protein
MAEIVNLKAARKARDKAAARVKADANAAKHGRAKALKALEKARADKEKAALDGHLREGQD